MRRRSWARRRSRRSADGGDPSRLREAPGRRGETGSRRTTTGAAIGGVRMSEPKRTRLIVLGFADPGVAQNVLHVIEQGIKAKEITVEDWALVSKAPGGKVTVTKDRN